MDDYMQKLGKGLAIGVWLTASTLWAYNGINYIRDNKTNENYLKQSEIHITSKDLDGDKKLETILNYHGKSYLMIDENGTPKLHEYELINDSINKR